MERQQRIDDKVILGTLSLLVSLMAVSVGVGWRLIDDRMAIEAEAVAMRAETTTALATLQRDVGETKDAIKILAKNSSDLLVVISRVDVHDKEIDRLLERVGRLEQNQ